MITCLFFDLLIYLFIIHNILLQAILYLNNLQNLQVWRLFEHNCFSHVAGWEDTPNFGHQTKHSVSISCKCSPVAFSSYGLIPLPLCWRWSHESSISYNPGNQFQNFDSRSPCLLFCYQFWIIQRKKNHSLNQ